MSTTFPALSKNSKPQEIQNFLNAVALDLQQKSQAQFHEITQKENPLDATVGATDELINSLFQKISTESLEQVGIYLMSHPDAIITATTVAVGVPPNPVSVGVLGLMMLAMSSTTASNMAAAASKNLEEFIKTNSKVD